MRKQGQKSKKEAKKDNKASQTEEDVPKGAFVGQQVKIPSNFTS
jgi:hypothetical protein